MRYRAVAKVHQGLQTGSQVVEEAPHDLTGEKLATSRWMISTDLWEMLIVTGGYYPSHHESFANQDLESYFPFEILAGKRDESAQ